jgi:HAMP domain-containing protein
MDSSFLTGVIAACVLVVVAYGAVCLWNALWFRSLRAARRAHRTTREIHSVELISPTRGARCAPVRRVRSDVDGLVVRHRLPAPMRTSPS